MALSQIPAQFLRSHEAPKKRTLIDILNDTVAAYADAPAIDDGDILTYTELWDAATERVAELHSLGIRRGDRI